MGKLPIKDKIKSYVASVVNLYMEPLTSIKNRIDVVFNGTAPILKNNQNV